MTSVPIKVLVVDSEWATRALLRRRLLLQGYEVLEATTGHAAIEFLGRKPALILLDPGLSDIGEGKLLRRIREWSESVPVVIISEQNDEVRKIDAFNRGANDYLTKPFGVDELLARMRVALRRQLQAQGVRPFFRAGGVYADLVRRIVTVNGRDARLSPKQHELFCLFVKHEDRALSHEFLLETVWGAAKSRQHLRESVQQLRRRIEIGPECPRIIHTEHGIGYRLRGPDAGTI